MLTQRRRASSLVASLEKPFKTFQHLDQHVKLNELFESSALTFILRCEKRLSLSMGDVSNVP